MKERLLNISLVFLVTLLLVNLFLPKPGQKAGQSEGMHLIVAKSDYVVPNMPVAEVVNNTKQSFTFNTCKEFEILKDYKKIEGLSKDFCKDYTVAAQGKAQIDFTAIHALFRIPGEYGFRLTTGTKEPLTAHFTLSEQGFFRTFFSRLFYAPVFNLFVYLIDILPGHSLGFAIIAVTILVRLALLVPQHHILLNTKKMQAIQPKIKEIQEKHKGDQAKIGMELMDLYKKEGVNPLGSCLPLLIQMPLLIVLYWVVLGITDISNSFYLYSFLSNFNISMINTNFFGIELLKIGGITGVVLAIVVGIAQWLQISLSMAGKNDTKKGPNKGALLEKNADGNYDSPAAALDPEIMNKVMLWGMPVMIGVSTYFFPAGVGIYWLIGTLFMLVQQIVVNAISRAKSAK